MAFTLPPPPATNDVSSPAYRDWFFKLGQAFTSAGSILWSAITLPTTSANQFLGGPVSGSANTASFRNITPLDLSTSGGTANQLLGMNNAATGLEYKTVVPGANITVTQGVNSVTIASTAGGGAALNNIIAAPATILPDTSYPIIQYLNIQSDLTVQGNVDVLDGSGMFDIRNPSGSAGQFLQSNGPSTVPTWAPVSGISPGPAFSAYCGVATALPNITNTKIAFTVKDYDTASAYDNITNFRFTPQVAGYYQINAGLTTATITFAEISIYLNGSSIAFFYDDGSASSGTAIRGSFLVHLNGTTDYLEIWGYQNSGSSINTTASHSTYFQAFLARAN